MRFFRWSFGSGGFAALVIVAAAIGTAVPSQAGAAVGGLGASGTVAVADVTCVVRCVNTRKAMPGAKVRLRGLGMDEVASVVFRGEGGPIQVPPVRVNEVAAVARVPNGARSGRPYVVDSVGTPSRPAPRKLYILPPSAIPSAVFPVRGPHSFWDGFGGGRGHEGVDIGAACGTPLVAALPGRVSHRAYQGAAGNYVVIDVEGVDADIGYMHMAGPGSVRVGQKVSAGQTVGYVGETGRASGCHLHFEYWVGDWWRGGSPIDPLPYLQQWDPSRRSAEQASRRALRR